MKGLVISVGERVEVGVEDRMAIFEMSGAENRSIPARDLGAVVGFGLSWESGRRFAGTEVTALLSNRPRLFIPLAEWQPRVKT